MQVQNIITFFQKMNLDIKLDDMSRISKETQMFILKKIWLNFKEDISNINHTILPEINGRAQVSSFESVLEKWDKDFENLVLRKKIMKHDLKCKKKSSYYNFTDMVILNPPVPLENILKMCSSRSDQKDQNSTMVHPFKNFWFPLRGVIFNLCP